MAFAVVLAGTLVAHARIPATSLWRGTLAGVTVGLVLAAVLGTVLVALPVMLVPSHPDLDQERLLKARNDVRVAGIQVLGGVALLAGLVFTNRTLSLNQQGQITDRFSRATDQLGSDKLSTRLGGIYSLERIARDSKPDQEPVMELLTAFVRDASTTMTAVSAGPSRTAPVPTDVAAALAVVGRRITDNDPLDYSLFLAQSDLAGARLEDADFRDAILEQSNLFRTDLIDAKVEWAKLSGADLSRADLAGADFSDADLSGVNFSGACLDGTVLDRTNLTGANFTGADLKDASLGRADLRGVVGLHTGGAGCGRPYR